jgi:predicted PurR-regulated permease PerM
MTSSPRWSTDTKRLVALFTVVLIGLAINRFNFVLGPLAIAILLTYLLDPIADFLERRLRLRRSISVIVVLLTLLALLLLLSALLVQSIIVQLRSLNLDLNTIGAQVGERLAEPLVVGDLRIDLQAVFESLRGSINTILQTIVNRAVDFGANLAEGLVWLIFIFISMFYLMKDWHAIGRWLENAMPPGFHDDFVYLRGEIAQTWNNFFRGQLVLAITMGVVVGVTMWAIGLPNALIIGVLFGVLEVVPNFGPVIASIPTILIALFQGSSWMFVGNNLAFAVVVVIVSFLLQQTENAILVPRILGHHLNLHPVAVLVVVIAGASLAGVLGILLASPVLATLRVIGRYVAARLLDHEPFPAQAQPPGT